MSPTVIAWFLLSMAAYAVGAYSSKLYATTNAITSFLAAMVGFVLCSAFWMPAISSVNKLAMMGTIWSVAYVIVDCTIGMGMFGEALTSVQACGIVLGVASIVLMCL